MEHRTVNDLQTIATTLPINGPAIDGPAMSRRQRLERWAAVLEQDPQRPVKLLRQVEFVSAPQRAAMRADNSPLALAFADPVLRHEGLSDDTLGRAETFFSLGRRQAHYLVCDCHFHGAVNAGQIAARVRVLANRPTMTERYESIRRAVLAWAGPIQARVSG